MSNENNEYTLNYEKLYLGKKEMLEVIDQAVKNIKASDIGSRRLTLGVLGVKALIGVVDEKTLNVIWNEIIKFTDELRYKNAKKDPDSMLHKLNQLKSDET